jgi:hypothetical protein
MKVLGLGACNTIRSNGGGVMPEDHMGWGGGAAGTDGARAQLHLAAGSAQWRGFDQRARPKNAKKTHKPQMCGSPL